MYWVMLHAHPKPDSDDYGTVDGGWASCFVNADDVAEAETRARVFLADHGWDSGEVEEAKPVRRDEYHDNLDSLAKFDQALIDGLVITLHMWDVGAPDE